VYTPHTQSSSTTSTQATSVNTQTKNQNTEGSKGGKKERQPSVSATDENQRHH
jgi:hypothetical protein